MLRSERAEEAMNRVGIEVAQDEADHDAVDIHAGSFAEAFGVADMEGEARIIGEALLRQLDGRRREVEADIRAVGRKCAGAPELFSEQARTAAHIQDPPKPLPG